MSFVRAFVFLAFALCLEIAVSRESFDPHAHVHRLLELQARWGGDVSFNRSTSKLSIAEAGSVPLGSKLTFLQYNYGGISTFAHLQAVNCFGRTATSETFDIAVIGVPWEGGAEGLKRGGECAISIYQATLMPAREVKSRCRKETDSPGSRSAPSAIRQASSRINSYRGLNHRAGINPFRSWARIVDCGDVPVDGRGRDLALRMMEEGYRGLNASPRRSTKGSHKPIVITMGGETSAGFAINALRDGIIQNVAFVSFGSAPDYTALGDSVDLSSSVAIGYDATSAEGAKLRAIHIDDIDILEADGIAAQILDHTGSDIPIYLSINLNILDAGLAPGTSNPQVGGWTQREMVAVLRGIEALNVVGAEVVGVAPAYDSAGEQTALFAAQVVYEILTSVVKRHD
jgi:agmatinase